MDKNMLFRSKIQVVDIPGKGKGIIATEDIQECEVILSEKPMMKESFRESRHFENIPPSEWKAVVKAVDHVYRPKFEALSDAEKEQYMGLHDCHVDEGEEKTLAGIFRTNSIGDPGTTQLDATFGAIYNTFSRFNHSCRPNVDMMVRGSEHLVLYATRTIRKGEELYISYIEARAPKHVRQKKLERYNFQCACEACAMPDSSKSDQNREEILKMDDLISRRNIEPLLKIYQMCEEEGVFEANWKAALANEIVTRSFELRNRPRAEVAKYAEDAYRCSRLSLGDLDENTRIARECVRMCETDTKYRIGFCDPLNKKDLPDVKPLDVDEEGKKALPKGTDVVLFGLQRTELNGRCGTIVEYKKKSGRYGVVDVPGFPNGLALKPANFAQKVFIVEDAAAGKAGFKSHTVKQVCGCKLNADGIYEYTFKDQDTAEFSSLPVTSIELPIGCDVRVHGLQSDNGRPLNETYGTIQDFDHNTNRYGVHFGPNDFKILPKNLAF